MFKGQTEQASTLLTGPPYAEWAAMSIVLPLLAATLGR